MAMTAISRERRCASGSVLKARRAGREPKEPAAVEAGTNPNIASPGRDIGILVGCFSGLKYGDTGAGRGGYFAGCGLTPDQIQLLIFQAPASACRTKVSCPSSAMGWPCSLYK